jgi:lactocepin
MQDLFDFDVDETTNLFTKIRLTPVEAEYLDITFSSSNTAVATIDETGFVTCTGAGETVITATSKADASVSAVATVKVFAIQPGFTITNGVMTAYDGPGGDIRIPGTARSIAAGVLKNNQSITSIHLNKVETLENEAIRESKNITKVIAPNLKIIKNSVFQECEKLEIIEMEKVTSMNQYVFYKTALKSVYMPSLVSITDRRYQFGECKDLVSVDMPELQILGNYGTFLNCTSLKNVNLPKLRTFDGGVNGGTGVETFMGCSSLEEISLPSITMLKDNTFAGCIALKQIDLSLATGLTSVTNTAVPDLPGLNIYVATEQIKNLFTGSTYTVTVGSPVP